MGRLLCPCGRTLHSTDESLLRQFVSFVLTPSEMEALVRSVERGEDEPELRELWRCECGRIAIDDALDEASGASVTWYKPDDSDG